MKKNSTRVTFNIFASLLVYFVVRVNQTNVLDMLYNREYTKGTLGYTLYDCLFPYEVSSLIILMSIAFFVIKAPRIDINWCGVISAIGLGLSSILGISFRMNGTWNLATSANCIGITSIYVIGFVVLIAVVIGYAEKVIIYLNAREISDDSKILCLLKVIVDNKKYSFLFTILCWSVWLVFRFPGGIQWDEFNQINMFLDHNIKSQHWPFFTTLYYGGFVYFGIALFHSENIGLFFSIIGQMIYGAAIVTYTLSVLKRNDSKSIFRTITMLVFAINPIIARYITTASKDAVYAMTMLWLCSTITDFLICGNRSKSTYIRLSLCSIVLCLTRKNGVYTLVPVIVLMLLFSVFSKDEIECKESVDKKELSFKREILTAIVVLCLGIVIESTSTNALAAMGIKKGPMQESLSVPLQQTARLSRDYPEIVSDEDRTIINKVIDFDYIGKAYNPKNSDAVKDTYYGKNISDFVGYMKVWTKYLVKVPSIYIQAFFHMNGDFLDVNVKHIELSKLDVEVTNRFEPFSMEGKFRIFTDFYEGLPLLWPFCNVGIQSWLSVYIILYFISKRMKKEVILSLPAVITLGICLMGPTFSNQGIRYLLPVMVVNPFVWNFLCSSVIKKDEV